jgi:hypothetical protein
MAGIDRCQPSADGRASVTARGFPEAEAGLLQSADGKKRLGWVARRVGVMAGNGLPI